MAERGTVGGVVAVARDESRSGVDPVEPTAKGSGPERAARVFVEREDETAAEAVRVARVVAHQSERLVVRHVAMEAPYGPGPERARTVAVERRDPVLRLDATGEPKREALGGLRCVGVDAEDAVERAEPEPSVAAVEYGADPHPLTVDVDLYGKRQHQLDLSAADPPELRPADPERTFGV